MKTEVNQPFLWPPYGIEQAIIFLPCDFYLSSSSSSIFFSSPNLSGRRVEAYHTWCGPSANLEYAGQKCAARGSLKIQDAKNRHFGTIAQLFLRN